MSRSVNESVNALDIFLWVGLEFMPLISFYRSVWSSCPSSSGTKMRTRSCDGAGCLGSSTESIPCDPAPAPAPAPNPNGNTGGSWSDWSTFSGCSATCDSGWKLRTRTCPTNSNCLGDSEQREVCYGAGKCSSWGGWGEWSLCDRPCGGGSRHRVRNCYGVGSTCDGNFGTKIFNLCFYVPIFLDFWAIKKLKRRWG